MVSWAMLALKLLIAFVFVTPAISSDFRGSLISWRPVNPERFDGRIEITHHVAWKGTTGCDVDAIGQQTLLDGRGMLVCQSGCSGVLGNMSFICSLFNQAEDWIAGKRSYITTFGRNVITFEAIFGGNNWISNLEYGSGKPWEVRVKGDVSVRDDTGRINTSPVTGNRPIVRIRYDQPSKFIIPVEDIDGDVVRCRWANSSLNECGGVCNAFPFGTLDEDTCTVAYNGFGTVDGLYAVAVQIEDFATSTSTTPLSSVPIQFLVHTFRDSDNPSPIFDNSTLTDGSRITVSQESLFDARIVVESGSAFTAITAIHTVSPPGLVKTGLRRIQGTRKWYIDVTWTPPSSGTDVQDFCFQAFDSNFQPSETRCVTLVPAGEVSLLWMCKKNILLRWNLPESVGNIVEEFRVTNYIIKGRRDIKKSSTILGEKRRIYNFTKRTPGKMYRFTIEMKLEGESQYEMLGSLVVGRRCPGGEECCSVLYCAEQVSMPME